MVQHSEVPVTNIPHHWSMLNISFELDPSPNPGFGVIDQLEIIDEIWVEYNIDGAKDGAGCVLIWFLMG
jgi:hypothetical protein